MSGFEVEALKALPPCHPQLVEAIITQIKSQGLFDDFRKSCLSDIDTKPSYLNLKQRVEGYVNNFLSRQKWSSSLQKNQLRETLRKDINQSGLLKTGLDHLVDQLLYAHAEKSIRPQVRAEIKKFLNLSEVSDRNSSVPTCVSNYPIAPPNYGPPAMPPLPPVPPPPDVAGAMIDTFGGLKPPEPPSPHGSEYSVDMSDSSMVGRDETPPAIPSRVTTEKLVANDKDIMSSSPMDLEETSEDAQVPKKDEESEALIRCSSPEIFEEVSEGGSLGGTPVRDEEASQEKDSKSDRTRTDFTGLFKDNRPPVEQASNETGVVIDEGSMSFEVSEECVKSDEAMRVDDGASTPAVDEDVVSVQDADLEVASVTPIQDENPEDDNDDDMQISADEETQCVDEVESLSNEARTEIKTPERIVETAQSSSQMPDQLTIVEGNSPDSLDGDLSDTQPPLQIDTEDTELTTENNKNQVDEGSENEEKVADTAVKTPETLKHPPESQNERSMSSSEANEKDGDSNEREEEPVLEKPEVKESTPEEKTPEKVELNNGERSVEDVVEEKPKTQDSSEGSTNNHNRDSKHKERKSSSHQKSSSRSESDRYREHKSSSHHSSSVSSSSRSKKPSKEHEQRSRDKDHGEKRSEDRKDKNRERRKERDSKDRDRSQRDSKHRSSSHSRRKHSRHHQDRRRDDERKTQSSTGSSSNKSSRTKSEERISKHENSKHVSEAKVEDTNQSKNQPDEVKSTVPIEENQSVAMEAETKSLSASPENSTPTETTTTIPSTSKRTLQAAEKNPDSEVPPKKRKRNVSKQHDPEEELVTPEIKELRKEAPAGKGRRRSSAASVTSQQSLDITDQPESPVPSKFGRQRKINPKYEDDGTLSALLFGKN